MPLTFQPISDSNLPDDLKQDLQSLNLSSVEETLAVLQIPELREFLIQQSGLAGDKLNRLITELEKRVDSEIVSQYLAPVPKEHVESWLFGCFAPKELPAEIPKEAEPEVPFSLQALDTDRVNHIDSLQPIKSQGGRGTCVAFGTVCAREFLVGPECDLSEQYLYWGAKKRDDLPDAEGTWIRYAIQCLEEEGVCREELWSYNPDPDDDNLIEPSEEAKRDAANYKIAIGEAIQPTSVNDLRRYLAGWDGKAGRVISFAIPVFQSWYRNPITYRTGRIPMPLPDESFISGHCMTLVGFEDNDEWPGGGFFIFRNSWGTGWAEECPYGSGYGTIPYAFMARHGWEAYACFDGAEVPDDEDEDGDENPVIARVEKNYHPVTRWIIDSLPESVRVGFFKRRPKIVISKKKNRLRIYGRNLDPDRIELYCIDDSNDACLPGPELQAKLCKETKSLYTIEKENQKDPSPSYVDLSVSVAKTLNWKAFREKKVRVKAKENHLPWLGPLGKIVEGLFLSLEADCYVGLKGEKANLNERNRVRLFWDSPASYLINPFRHPLGFMCFLLWLITLALYIPVHQVFAGILLWAQWPNNGIQGIMKYFYNWEPVLIPGLWFFLMVLIVLFTKGLNGTYVGKWKRFFLLFLITILLAPSGIMLLGLGFGNEAASAVLNRRFSRSDTIHQKIREYWPYAVNRNWLLEMERSESLGKRLFGDSGHDTWFYELDNYHQRKPIQVTPMPAGDQWKKTGVAIKVNYLDPARDRDKNPYQDPLSGIIIRRGDTVSLYDKPITLPKPKSPQEPAPKPVPKPAPEPAPKPAPSPCGESVPGLIGKLFNPKLSAELGDCLTVHAKPVQSLNDIGRVVAQDPSGGTAWPGGGTLKIWVGRHEPDAETQSLLGNINAAVQSALAGTELSDRFDDITLEGNIRETIEEKQAPFGKSSRWQASHSGELVALNGSTRLFSFPVESRGDLHVRKDDAISSGRKKLTDAVRLSFLKQCRERFKEIKSKTGTGNPPHAGDPMGSLIGEGESMIREMDQLIETIEQLIGDMTTQ